jgi:hypothetical protein
MKSLFEPITLHEITNRLDQLTPVATPQWGKMDVSQMLAHCSNGMAMAMGTIKPKRTLIGKLIGPLFRSVYSNDKPFAKEGPTSDELRVTDECDFKKEKARLKELIIQFSNHGPEKVTNHPHPFFGPLTSSEWGIGMYKHLDHHFRQFNV